MNLTFSDLVGFHEENQNCFWLSRCASASIHLHADHGEQQPTTSSWQLLLTLTAGPVDLYEYFPFLAFVQAHGKCLEILQFDYPQESLFVSLTCRDSLELSIFCEQGCIPKRKQISDDERELAILMHYDLHVLNDSVGKPEVASNAMGRVKSSRVPTSSWRDQDDSRPIFVLGAYRSGTSILTWALGQHPNISALEETGWFGFMSHGLYAGFDLASQAQRSFFDVYGISIDEMMIAFGQKFDELLTAIVERQQKRIALRRLSGMDYRHHPDFSLKKTLWGNKRRWVDGTPENVGCVPMLRKLFPRAQFIFVFRDPLGVVGSLTRMSRVGGPPMPLETALDFWIKMTEQGMIVARAYGSQTVKVVNFANLVKRPSDALEQLFEFLDEPRFQKASSVFATRINSSVVSTDERQETLLALQDSRRFPVAQKLFNRCTKLAEVTHLEPDESYQNILIDQVNDFQTELFYLLEDE